MFGIYLDSEALTQLTYEWVRDLETGAKCSVNISRETEIKNKLEVKLYDDCVFNHEDVGKTIYDHNEDFDVGVSVVSVGGFPVKWVEDRFICMITLPENYTKDHILGLAHLYEKLVAQGRIRA